MCRKVAAFVFTSPLRMLIEDACGGSSPHPQTTPPSNLRILCDHLHPSHGSAGRGQGENNCNDFRCEFFLLDTTSAATNAEVHEKSNAEIRFFLRFWHDLGCPGVPQRQLRRRCQRRHQNVSGVSPFWGAILHHFGSRILFVVHFVCANFYAYFWHRFWEAFAPNFVDLGVISGCLLGSF